MSRALLPWPLPVQDVSTGAVTYAPNLGKLTKRFRTMYQAQDYEAGARYRLRGHGLHSEASVETRDGWCDMDQIVAEHYAPAAPAPEEKTTFTQYLGQRIKAANGLTDAEILARATA
jgi:hypothetical protein